jgi:hypothetical protein
MVCIGVLVLALVSESWRTTRFLDIRRAPLNLCNLFQLLPRLVILWMRQVQVGRRRRSEPSLMKIWRRWSFKFRSITIVGLISYHGRMKSLASIQFDRHITELDQKIYFLGRLQQGMVLALTWDQKRKIGKLFGLFRHRGRWELCSGEWSMIVYQQDINWYTVTFQLMIGVFFVATKRGWNICSFSVHLHGKFFLERRHSMPDFILIKPQHLGFYR